MAEKISRREFIKRFTTAVGGALASKPAEWLKQVEPEHFLDMIHLGQVCKEILQEDELADLLDCEDLAEALGLAFSFLLAHGEDPEQFLIMQDFLMA